MTDYSLYLITDDKVCHPDNMVGVIDSLITEGISCVQLRMKNREKKDIVKQGRQLIKLLRPHNIKLIVNDYIDIANEIDADGVHLGQQDDTIKKAHQRLAADKIIGLSIETIEQAEHCAQYDVDYFGVGPIFPTISKENAALPIGLDALCQIRSIIDKPIVAIGGIQLHNVASVIETGVEGIAIISAVLATPNRKTVCRQFKQRLLHRKGQLQ